MSGTLIDILLNEESGAEREPEIVTVKGQKYVVFERRQVNANPRPGEAQSELVLKKPKGEVLYAADEVYAGMAKPRSTGIAWLDEGLPDQPVIEIVLRPDRGVSQGDLGRKIQPKSPCCNRTMREESRGAHLRPRYFCRRCDREVVE